MNSDGSLEVANKAELEGVGPVPKQSVIDLFEQASFKLVGTRFNKLVWFSEQDRRSRTKELPEYVKRAVKLKAYGRCEVDQCVNFADHVDHITARCNNGINDLSNLQAICEADHHAKTQRDAPWTASEIYRESYLNLPDLHLPDTG